MQYTTLLFDLDGTLTDPYEGITNAIAYALRVLERPCPDGHTLRKFIGPPLLESFERYCALSPVQAQEALKQYRVYFSDKGLFENRPYDGIASLLGALKGHGYRIVLATSKPEVFARRILERFELIGYFDFIAGSLLDGGRPTKADVIAYALAQTQTPPQCALMIGDRIHDIQGAQQCGIDAVGVLYGYGTRHEFDDAVYIAQDPASLERFLIPCAQKKEG